MKLEETTINSSNVCYIYLMCKLLANIEVGTSKSELLKKICDQEKHYSIVYRAFDMLLSPATILLSKDEECIYVSERAKEKALVLLDTLDEFLEIIKYG